MSFALIRRQPWHVSQPVRLHSFICSRCFSSLSQRFGILGLHRTDDRDLARENEPRKMLPKKSAPGMGGRRRPFKVYPPPPSARKVCKDPVAAFQRSQLETLDPYGSRARLFSRDNPEAAKVGDILLVRTKTGEPFAGVCINIRRQGIDTAILLRNQLTRVGVEIWFKIYSPNVEGMEVVQRRQKRARRARLYYMRKPKHDLGSVENIVSRYLRQRQALRGDEVKSRDANAHKRRHAKSK